MRLAPIVVLVGLLAVGAAAQGAGASAGPNASSHTRVSRAAGAQIALRALAAGRRAGAQIVFGSLKPLPAGTVIREGGPRSPAAGGLAAKSSRRVIASVGGSSWLFYEDLAPFQQYAHAGRVALVDARTGRVTVSPTLPWPPLVGGALPAFLASQRAYDSPRYRVLYRPYSGAGTRASADAPGIVAMAARDVNAALDPSGGASVAQLLAAQHACAVRFSDTVPGGYYAYAQIAQSRGALAYRLEQLSRLAPGYRSTTYSSRGGVSPAEFVGRLISGQGCRDVLLDLAGGGYATQSAINIGMGLGSTGRHQDVTPAQLRNLVTSHRRVNFELVLDAPHTSVFQGLASLSNLLLVATPRAPGGGSFTYLPEARVGGVLVPNEVNPLHLLQLTDRLAFGIDQVIGDPREVAQMQSLRQAGKLPSAQAYLIARAFDRGGAVDFVANSGVGSPPRVQIHGFTANPPGGSSTSPGGSSTTPGGSSTTPSSQPPALSAIETSTLQYAAGSAPVAVTSSLSVGDPGAADLSGATVKISSGLVATEDSLGFTSQNGITGSYDSATGVLTLSGTSSVSNYQSALRSVTFRDSNGSAPVTGTRTVSFQVSDARASNNLSNVASRDVSVNPNSPPTAVDDSASTGKHTAVDIPVLANDSDPDGDRLSVASVDTTGTKGSVSVNSDGTIHYDPNGQFDSLNQGQTATDTFTYKASDGYHDSNSATVTVTITGSNDAPVLSGIETSTLQYDAGTPPAVVTQTLAVSDDDDTTLAGATVKIASGLSPGEDALHFTDQNGITGSYDAATGVLTLTGTASLGDYQAALRSVTYSDSNGATPDTGMRTISFQVDDGHSSNNLSNVVSREVSVNPNPPPTAVDDSASTGKHTAVDIPVLVNDSDPDGDTLHVASVDTAGTKGAVSINPDGTIHYDPNGQFDALSQGQTATDTFTYQASDGYHDSNSATVTVTVNGSNDAPVLSNIETTALSYRAQDPAVPITSTLTVSDDDDATLSGATVSITSGFSTIADQLSFTNQNGITGSYNPATGVLTLSGAATVADYQAALRSVGFSTSDASTTPASRTVSFSVTDSVGATSTTPATRTIDVAEANQPPTASNVSYSAVGNTPLGVGTTPSAPSTTVNDNLLNHAADPDSGGPVTLTGHSDPAHGTVTMNPDGTFTYEPDAGFTGADTFTYTVTDQDDAQNPKSATGTVTINVGTVVWYVDDSKTSAGDGRANSPFNTLAAANTAAGANSIVFLYQGNATYAGGVSLHSGESLYGQPHGLTVSGNNLVSPSGSNPTITNPGGDGVDLGEGSDVEAVNVSSPSGDGVAASNVNAATVGGTNPVAILGAGGDGIHVSGGNGSLNFANTSVTGSAGHSLLVSSHTGGTDVFGGGISDSGTGISLTGNSGATIILGGRLTISSGANPGFLATGGGTVTATASGSTITSTTGDALDVENTAIGADGLNFQSITSNGAVDGIKLASTGTSGGLTVTGTGAAGSGGTIQRSTGAGISLSSTSSPSFTDMVVENGAADGVNGASVNGFTLAGSTVNGNGTTSNQDGLNFSSGLTGTVAITNSTISNSADSNAQITNSSGSLNLTVSGSTFSGTGTTESVMDGLQVIGNGSSSSTVSVTGSTFTNNYGGQLDFQSTSGDTGTNSVTFSNNTLNESIANAGGGLEILESGAGSTALTVSDNTIKGAEVDGITLDDDGAGGYYGTINGNTVGDPNTVCSGSVGGYDISATAEGSTTDTLAITNNKLYQYNNAAGLNVLDREGSATMNMTITGNTIADPVPASSSCRVQGGALWGLVLYAGAQTGDTSTVCANISGNSMTGSAPSAANGGIDDFELDEYGSGIFKLPGYTGGSTDSNAVVSFIQGNNNSGGPPSGDTFIQGTGSGGGYFFGASSCPTPP